MTTTYFESNGRVETKDYRTWDWLIDHVIEEIQKDIDEFDLTEFSCTVEEGNSGDRYYNWHAEGEVIH